MKYGDARVSTDGQGVDAPVRQLTKAGCKKVFREMVAGAKTGRAQRHRAIDQLEAGGAFMVTWLDRVARSSRDLLSTLAAIIDRKAGFRSLADAWADTTTPHGRLMLALLGGLAEFEGDLIRARTNEGRKRAVARGLTGCGKRRRFRRCEARVEDRFRVLLATSTNESPTISVSLAFVEHHDFMAA
jgi:DNA invertase Pin-like site-specific DNA recombinase